MPSTIDKIQMEQQSPLLLTKKELVTLLFERGIMIDRAVIEKITVSQLPILMEYVEQHKELTRITQIELDALVKEKSTYFASKKISLSVEIKRQYKDKNAKKTVRDFVAYYHHRYRVLKNILQAREGLGTVTSINKLSSIKDNDEVSIIGMVRDIGVTKNGHKMVVLEDISGEIKVLVNKNRPDIVLEGKDLIEDEIIAVRGKPGDKIFFANKIFYPEIPLNRELKKAENEVYMAVISDLHFGTKDFAAPQFEQFIRWIRGEEGSEQQKYIAQRVGYLFIVGDLVAGVGIYPGQEKILTIKDCKGQFDGLVGNYLSRIPSHIKIICCAGNHDPVRLAEPQPVFPAKYAEALYALPNVIVTTNPGVITIHKHDTFPGFDVLLYHGFSYFFVGDRVESIRDTGGINNVSGIMKCLLRKRHLAPTHDSTQYIPDKTEDFLLIQDIPDFFLSGHVHKLYAEQYRYVTLLTGTCFQNKTDYEEKLGREPEVGRVPVVNLQTREIKIFRFDGDEEK